MVGSSDFNSRPHIFVFLTNLAFGVGMNHGQKRKRKAGGI